MIRLALRDTEEFIFVICVAMACDKARITKNYTNEMKIVSAVITWLTVVVVCLFASPAVAEPVRVIALDFVGLAPLVGATLEWIETGAAFITDSAGVVMLDAPVGASVTISFAGNEKYHQTQSSTVEVPVGGLTNILDQLVMQVPTHFLFDVFSTVSPGEKNLSNCQVVVTVCNVNKTVYDPEQGLLGTVATLTPATESKVFYFGTWGKWSNATNPLPNNLTSSSLDGGVLFENIPPNPDQWYEVTAAHPGYVFTNTRFRCLKAGFVNAAPNQGPRATKL